MKRTKIICTLGPASANPGTLEKMINAGMNIARLNFSHSSHEEQAERIRLVRETAANLGKTIGILADIQGPKIRTGMLHTDPLVLNEGDRILLTVDPAQEAKPGYIYVKYPTLISDVNVENRIFLADGLIALKVIAINELDVECEVIAGGELTSKKGVTLPGVSVKLPALTEKDKKDIEFVVSQKVDIIAISFARKAEHLVEIRDFITSLGGDQMIIAKIENEEGFSNSEEILQVCDGIMVARGDLGIEVPPEEVPLIQRYLIELCNNAGKPVITATEMLESMIRNPRPTRAEITDIAHAILDGTDAIMLSAETAVGKHPVAAVEIMTKVAQRIEDSLKFDEILAKKKIGAFPTISDAISHATCQTALDLKAVAIITSTQSGSTARMVSKYRPQAPIIATTPSERVACQLALNYGVFPIVVPEAKDIDSMIDVSIQAAKQFKFISENDLVVITAGVRTGIPGSTNLLKVHYIE
ncbi:MAG TPA: pyruvate kinase [Bacillota bacterium]|nr:pyruvate kinase [Bacillota bacterium]HOL10386.1 pyruvate kinase [Bacillota bacterium]HPO97439.1 pyruvate kinase [Bacillota bacterium]